MSEGRAILDSGVLHFRGEEVVQTSTTPNIWFGAGKGEHPEFMKAEEWPGGIYISVYLQPGDQYAGVLTYNQPDGPQYEIYYVVHRISELKSGPFYEARFTLTEA